MAKAVLFDRLGGPEVLQLKDVELGSPGREELRIRVEAIGLNRSEAMFRAGTYFYQPSLPSSRLGYEAAGVVESVGADVQDFAAGDLIISAANFEMGRYGVYGDEVIIPASSTLHRPGTVDAVSGAAIWMAYSTAYGALVEKARMRPGDTVLITAASSSVGIAAIQTANHLGAIPVAVTRRAEKKQRLLEIGAKHVIVGEGMELVEQLRAITGGRGAELVFDPIAGPGLETIAQALAADGTLVVYGWLDLRPAALPLNWGLKILGYNNFELTGSSERLRRAQHFINAGLRSGSFTPVIDSTFELSEIVDAHIRLESNVQVGKIVVTVTR
ncbi:zinc-dependent alcohol dehydrogenase family protein [Streptomyces sp. NPDC096153]|uniref:zinc-dependent alcohol dehydrogenase family protein n=1 Tax=Streptomyces sp. NPDC096153 TaxID=3155548 RepID=UPI003317F575